MILCIVDSKAEQEQQALSQEAFHAGPVSSFALSDVYRLSSYSKQF